MNRCWFSFSLVVPLGLVFFASLARADEASKAKAKRAVQVAEDLRSADQTKLSVDLESVEPKNSFTYDMSILRGTGRRALVTFLAPKQEIGRRLLAVKNKYWATFPDSKKVHVISRREMIGNSAFAIADLFQIDTENDYDSDLSGEETIENKRCLLIELKAKHDQAPYHRVVYAVEESGFFPVRAKFYGVSGKHLKTMTVKSRAVINGKMRPEKLLMVDEALSGKYSIWYTKSMKSEAVPEKVFTEAYLLSSI